jgi:hypothetical protein
MAERTMLVCDSCGRPAVETVTFKTSSGNRQRDYCSTHLEELLSGSRIPKRGRRPGSTNSASSAKKSTGKKSTARKASRAKKSTARKASGAKKSTRKKAAARA